MVVSIVGAQALRGSEFGITGISIQGSLPLGHRFGRTIEGLRLGSRWATVNLFGLVLILCKALLQALRTRSRP